MSSKIVKKENNKVIDILSPIKRFYKNMISISEIKIPNKEVFILTYICSHVYIHKSLIVVWLNWPKVHYFPSIQNKYFDCISSSIIFYKPFVNNIGSFVVIPCLMYL